MTRNRFLCFMSPFGRRCGLVAFAAAALLTQTCGSALIPIASAQSPNSQNNIRQVAGRGSSGGLLSGLFGRGSSNKSSSGLAEEPYRKATPVPSDRDVNWQGVPTHEATTGRTAAAQPMPIRDPGFRGDRATESNPTDTTRQSTQRYSARTPSSLPTPPPLVQSTPRRIESLTPTSESIDDDSNRPAPLSTTRSSRRPGASTSEASVPQKRVAQTPEVSTQRTAESDSRSPQPVTRQQVAELVPRVNRRTIETETTTQTDMVRSGGLSRRVTASVESESLEMDDSDSLLIAPQNDSPKLVAKPTAKPLVVSKSESMTKTESTQSEQIQSEQLTGPSVPAASIASAPAPAAAMKMEHPQPSIKMSGSVNAGLTDAGLADAGDDTPSMATLSLPETNPTGRMSTFGDDRGAAIASGSLTKINSTTNDSTTSDSTNAGSVSNNSSSLTGDSAAIALHPLSDRLPLEELSQADQLDMSIEAIRGSQNESHDGFAARSTDSFGPNAMRKIANSNTNTSAQTVSAPTSVTPTMPLPMVAADANLSPSGAAQSPALPSANGTSMGGVVRNSTATELPGIRVMTSGPRSVMIRQVHPYEVIVENRGSVAAQGLLVRAHVPDWADVVGQQVTRGDVHADTNETIRNLQWKIDRLEPGQSEKMFVRLKASRPGTHDLDVDWTLEPQTRKMQVTVQEPELALTIDGPDEVIYGQSKTYQIRVLNPGDGVASDVVFTLSPKSSSPQSQRIGDIPAGKEAQFEVELTAQDLGELKIHGLAVGDLQLRAETNKVVRVLAADLEATLTGPELKYQNAEAVYQLELANNGTTASDNVVANLVLPIGVSYLGGMEGATVVDKQLRWKVASLSPGAVRQYQFQCRMDATGNQSFKFDCKGSAAGQTAVSLDTRVDAIADLVLTIQDPTAPAPIGEDVSYQIVIRNRGSKPAMDVQAVAQFSHGIEPQRITGHEGKVITGQVLIEPIAKIDAGQEVRMTIVARAETAGHHRFRTEVRSGDTVLVAEEATHYLSPSKERITRRSEPGGNDFSLPLR